MTQNVIEKKISEKTVEFAKLVTNNSDSLTKKQRAKKIAKLFSKDAVLRGTVSQVIRRKDSKPNLEQYFLYFNRNFKTYLEVLDTRFDIQKISPGIWANYAYVKFQNSPEGDTLTALMTFIFKKNKDTKNWEIQTLHSSPIVNPIPPKLVSQGDDFSIKGWNLPSPFAI